MAENKLERNCFFDFIGGLNFDSLFSKGWMNMHKIKFEDVVFAIFFILSIIFAVWYIFGKSPTIEQSLLILMVGFLVKNYGDARELKADFKNLAGQTKHVDLKVEALNAKFESLNSKFEKHTNSFHA